MNKIDKLISIIRSLKEDGEGGGPPTNNTGSTPEVAGYSSAGDLEHAGYDLPVGKRRMMRRNRKFFKKSKPKKG